MPVKEFTGELDGQKKPKIRPFTGELDSDATDPESVRMASHKKALTKEEIARNLPMIGGIAGGLAVPGAGWGALALSSLAAGGGAAVGELGKQALLNDRKTTWDGYPAILNPDGSYSTRLTSTVEVEELNGGKPTNIPTIWRGKKLDPDAAIREAIKSGKQFPSFNSVDEAVEAAKALSDSIGGFDFKEAGKAGLEVGVGNLTGGTLVKGLGWVAKSIFGSGLSAADDAAMAAAKAQGAPFPLSIVKPSPAQRAADKFVLGKLGNQQQANKVTQWLNTKLASLTQKAAVFDDAAAKGQTFFKEMTEPGKNALRKTFDDFTAAVGADTKIPIGRTRSVAATALETLQRGGHTKNPLAVRLRSMLKARGMSAAEMTPAEIDGLMFGIARDTYSRGTNEAVVGAGEALMKALADDADDYAKLIGKSFAPEFQAAQASRAAYRELIKKVPQIATLAKEYGEQGATKGSIQWMNNLFTSGNGKALAEIRKANPQLYHDIADAWVASKINTFVKYNEQIGTNSLNGAGFRSWVEQNADTIKEVLGKDQFTALDNFSQYAATMTGSSLAKAGQPIPVQNMVFSGGMMTAAGFTSPWLLVPTEGAAFVLARGISDPSSALYKLFTNPATKEAVRAAGKAGGQAAAR